eukprot:scaffold229839_cov15-Tisochrysis_lutea.AAC.1
MNARAKASEFHTPCSLLLKSTTNSLTPIGCPEQALFVTVLHLSKPVHAGKNSEVRHLQSSARINNCSQHLAVATQ